MLRFAAYSRLVFSLSPLPDRLAPAFSHHRLAESKIMTDLRRRARALANELQEAKLNPGDYAVATMLEEAAVLLRQLDKELAVEQNKNNNFRIAEMEARDPDPFYN
jgi:hypothetical protein